MLLVKNGRVVDPARNTDASMDLLLDSDKIVEIAQGRFLATGSRSLTPADWSSLPGS